MEKKLFCLLNSEGNPLRGDIFIPENKKPPFAVVVICHGFKGFKDWGFFPYTARKLCEQGFCVVSFSFSGSGIGEDLENFTEPELFANDTFTKQLDDLKIIIDKITSNKLDQSVLFSGKVGLLGHSRGGAVVILFTQDDDCVDCLVTWGSIASVYRYSDEHVRDWETRGYIEIENERTKQMMRLNKSIYLDMIQNADKMDILAAERKIKAPHLIIHGLDDESVPVEEAEMIWSAADKERDKLVKIPGAGHTFGVEHPFSETTTYLEEAIAETGKWFQKFLFL